MSITQLPTQKTKKLMDPHKVNIVLYGPNGIGKTTFVNDCEDCMIIAPEAGQNAIEGYVQSVNTWEEFHDVCVLIKSGSHRYKRIAIDTGPGLYRLCLNHYCKKSGVEHISLAEGGWGRGPDVANNAFLTHIQGLTMLPYGLIFISHATKQTIKSASSADYIQHTVDLPEREKNPIRSQILGLFDIVFYMTLQRVNDPDEDENNTTDIKYRRVLKVEPSIYYEARDRYRYLPPTIILPERPENSYNTYVNAFIKGRNEKEGQGDGQHKRQEVPGVNDQSIPTEETKASTTSATTAGKTVNAEKK